MHPYVTKLMYQCCIPVNQSAHNSVFHVVTAEKWRRDSHTYINKRVHVEASLHFATCYVFSYGTFISILSSKNHKEINLLSI